MVRCSEGGVPNYYPPVDLRNRALHNSEVYFKKFGRQKGILSVKYPKEAKNYKYGVL